MSARQVVSMTGLAVRGVASQGPGEMRPVSFVFGPPRLGVRVRFVTTPATDMGNTAQIVGPMTTPTLGRIAASRLSQDI